MTTTKPKQMTEEQRERIRQDPRVIHHRSDEGMETWVPPFTTNGYIDTLELIGRRDDEDWPLYNAPRETTPRP